MRTKRAFTLMEVLLAVAVAVMVTAAMSATISIGFGLKRAAERAVADSHDITAVGDAIVADVADCVQPNPATTITDITQTIPNYMAGPFIGSSTDLTFTTTGPEPNSPLPSDMRWVEYTTSQDSNGSGLALIRNVNPNVLGDPTNTNFTQQLVIHNLVSLSFRYFDGTQWYDTWDSTQNNNALPMAVAVRIELLPEVAGHPNRVIERYVPLWCGVPSTQDSGGTLGL